MLKRISDLIIAICAIKILAPLMVVVAAVVRLDSAGPVLGRRHYAGKHNREFSLYKSRTMMAESHKHRPAIALDDPRLKRLGRLLRQWKSTGVRS